MSLSIEVIRYCCCVVINILFCVPQDKESHTGLKYIGISQVYHSKCNKAYKWCKIKIRDYYWKSLINYDNLQYFKRLSLTLQCGIGSICFKWHTGPVRFHTNKIKSDVLKCRFAILFKDNAFNNMSKSTHLQDHEPQQRFLFRCFHANWLNEALSSTKIRIYDTSYWLWQKWPTSLSKWRSFYSGINAISQHPIPYMYAETLKVTFWTLKQGFCLDEKHWIENFF